MMPSHSHRRRRGAILLVVLAMLALFAVVGLSFVLFAESEGTAGRIYREDKSKLTPLDPADAAGRAIGQMVWGTDDVGSVMRGHDLARLMYGELGEVPYNGVGTLHQTLTIPGVPGTVNRADVVNHALQQLTPANKDSWVLVDAEFVRPDGQVRTGAQKYTTSAGDTLRAYELPQVLFGRQTKLQGGQYDLTGASGPGATFPLTGGPPSGLYTYAAKNAPYTYVDRNNMMVGLTDPATGRVVVPSAHRPSLFYPAPLNTTLATATPDWFGDSTSNVNWTTPAGRFKILRPRPEDHKPAGGTSTFPYPPFNPDGSRTGDVQNLRFADGTQRNDSVWLDLNLPVVTDARGRRLVPLVAPLMVPLNGRVNLNVAGNLKQPAVMPSTDRTHASNMGFGPHEINPGALLPTADMVLGNKAIVRVRQAGADDPAVAQRPFAPDPADATKPLPLTADGRVNWDGTAQANWMALPGNPAVAAASGLQSSPTYQFFTAGTTDVTESQNHPTLWNAYQRLAYAVGEANPDPAATPAPQPKTYPVSDLQLFAGRFSNKPSAYTGRTFLANDRRGGSAQPHPAFQKAFLGDAAGNYTPGQGTGPNARGNLARALVTPVSNSLAAPGLAVNFPDGSVSLKLADPNVALAMDPNARLVGPALADAMAPGVTAKLPTFSVSATAPANAPLDRAFSDLKSPDPAGGASAQLRNLRASLAGVDVNRKLRDYRGTATTQSLANAATAGAITAATEADAWTDRQQLAADIFIRLAVAAGGRVGFDADPPATPPLPAGQRYLYAAPATAGTNTQARYVLPQWDTTGTPGYYLTVHTSGTPTKLPVQPEEFNALRWLAQLAANIVDAVDSDDVSTAFVWNPVGGTVPISPTPSPTVRDDMGLVANFSPTGTPSQLSTSVVFGVEKPRLVLNEVYAEVANDKGDRGGNFATKPFRVRFWVELLNPGNQETVPSAPQAGPDTTAGPNTANGGVALVQGGQSVYRLQVYDKGTPVLQQLLRPRNVTGSVDPADATAGPGETTTYPITGSLIKTSDSQPRLSCDLTPGASITPPSDMTASATQVEPNAGQPAAVPGTGRHGFAVIGPNVPKTTHDDGTALAPDVAGGQPFSQAILKAEAAPPMGDPNPTQDALDYTLTDLKPGNQIQTTTMSQLNADPNRHVVLLQRLANPYQPHNADTNPYLTVDVLSQVKVNDGIRVGNDNTRMPDANSHDEADKPELRAAVGRVQPYAGFQNFVPATATPPEPTYQFGGPGGTFTLLQTGTQTGTQQKFTLFRHNYQTNAPGATANSPATKPWEATPAAGAETLLSPFAWLTHPDRPLVNPSELGAVAAVPAHLVTRQFAKPAVNQSPAPVAPYNANVAFGRHALGATELKDGGGTTLDTAGPLYEKDAAGNPASGLYRALDVLQTKPWATGQPVNGRVAGKVNINMLWDEDPGTKRSRVFDAVLDRAAGGPNTFQESDRTAIWDAIKATRSPLWASTGTPQAGRTADESPLGYVPAAGTAPDDRPFKGLGIGLFQAAAATPAPTGVYQTASAGRQDTLLRDRSHAALGAIPAGDKLPLFRLTQATITSMDGSGNLSHPDAQHPWVQDEPLRKVMASLTTTTDTYLLLLTVGYFEVIEDDPGLPGQKVRILRAEAYDQAPGDLRAQFVAVLDRTNLGADAAGVLNQVAGQRTDQGGAPFVLESATAVTPPANVTDATNPDAVTLSLPATAVDATNSVLSGEYDGVAWSIRPGTTPARWFLVGTGDRQNLFEAFAGVVGGPTEWKADPANPGHFLIQAKYVLPGRAAYASYFATLPATSPLRTAHPHAAGEVVSNLRFSSPGPQPSKVLRPDRADPVVRLFTELK